MDLHHSFPLRIEYVPEELILKIFSFLTTPKDLAIACRVCKQWNQIAQEPLLWKSLILQRFAFYREEQCNGMWKKYYRDRVCLDAVPIKLPYSRILIQNERELVFTCSPCGKDVQPLSLDKSDPNVLYTQPTWSPHNGLLALTAFSRAGRVSELLIFNSRGERRARIPIQFPSFYNYWSPDSSRLLFLSSAGNSLIGLHVIDLIDEQPIARLIDIGRPYFYVWSPRKGSSQFLAHVGDKRLEVISVDGSKKKIRIPLGQKLGQFPTPSWIIRDKDNNIDEFIYVTETQSKSMIVLSTIDISLSLHDLSKLSLNDLKYLLEYYDLVDNGSGLVEVSYDRDTIINILYDFYDRYIPVKQVVIAQFDVAGVYFIVSPDSNKIAYVKDQQHLLYVLDIPPTSIYKNNKNINNQNLNQNMNQNLNQNQQQEQQQQQPLLIGHRVIGFYWSPNSRYILFLVTVGPSKPLQWHVYDYELKDGYFLSDFDIGSEFYGHYLPFFFQYSLSQSFFSPTSDSFVYTDSRGNVWVLSLEKGSKPVRIESGVYAVWSNS